MFFEAHHISKSFGSQHALSDVSIQVPQQCIYGLLGPNGAGKSTLIRIINRILSADQGRLMIEDRVMTDADVALIGYLPEERGLYKKMRVGEQALYLARLKGLSKQESTRRLHEWFQRLDIESWWDRRVEELSKGMQQKVQFIVTVLHEPRLLIFDEPFSGFDPVNAELLKQEILRLRDQGATVLFSTHNMASVEQICDRIALINQSKVVLEGDVDEIRHGYSQNRYRLTLRSSLSEPMIPDHFRLEQCARDGQDLNMVVCLPQGLSGNELIASLLPQGQLLEFQEMLPSMNEIFIQTVKGGKADE